MPDLTDADVAAIHDIIETQWPAASLRSDSDHACRLCTEDVVYMPQDHPVVLGRAQLHEFLDDFPDLSEFTQTCDYCEGDSQSVVTRGTFTAVFADGGLKASGKYLATLSRVGDEWLATSICFNWDAAMSAEA